MKEGRKEKRENGKESIVENECIERRDGRKEK